MFGLWGGIIDDKIKGTVDAHRIWSNTLLFTEAATGLFTAKGAGLKLMSANSSMLKLTSVIIPEDKNTGLVAKFLVDMVAEGKYLVVEAAVGTTAATPTVAFKLAQLANDTWAWSKVQDLRQKRQSLNVANEYLHEWYRYGGDRNKFAAAYGLQPGVSDRELLSTFAIKKFGSETSIWTWRSDYNLQYTWQVIITLANDFIAPAAEDCVANLHCEPT